MRARPGDTLSRLCVRRVLVVLAFPLASPLRSRNSAPVCPGLFVAFIATMGDSDFLESCIIGLRRYAFPMRTGTQRDGRLQDIPVPEQGTSVHAGVYDHAESGTHSQYRTSPCCLPPEPRCRHPGVENFRGSMAGLHTPLPTLR